ncbi:ribonuclease H-like YkuK family protein [Metabacillus halosaccharovorans]|uniref:Ribonuclease H-like YkuK family protein n=1 Tax=Metabacillus halosaccharovorans TaxID=930124 RepID=A0ABT3DK77_9BACI|nr:ribonuclease H-like YkuK family protein [Metabacillus halosaccharovorans]MCV9887441.1 ribonuclease H-like YkuK family protein [Metabacillus halosaccharovorans]
MNDSFTFYNVSEKKMSFQTVLERIKGFMLKDPRSEYVLSIGSDSHVHQTETKFITAIHLHRVGKGAWGCLKNHTVKRPITSIREKISMETALSQEIAYYFISKYLMELSDILIPFADEGADLIFEIHMDIGRRGMTKELIQEMTGRIEAMGIEAKIKPESYTAFSYANRYTK